MAISLLMDAPDEYSEVMLEKKMVSPLLAILDIQVTHVMELMQLGSVAAAVVCLSFLL
jgi:hypothetical protein